MSEKIVLKLKHVEFDRARFRKYLGNIGEMLAEEVLLKNGFKVWLLTPYFPGKSKRGASGTGLLFVLKWLRPTPTSQEQVHVTYGPKMLKEIELACRKVKSFFGADKLEAFAEYLNRLGFFSHPTAPTYTYKPDLVAKKNGKIYVVETKVNKGTDYLKKEKLAGLMLAKEYGFIPMLVTLSIDIEAADFRMFEL